MTNTRARVEPRYLTSAETSRYTGLHVRTLRALVTAGKLRAYRVTGAAAGDLRFDKDEIDEYVRSTVVPAATD